MNEFATKTKYCPFHNTTINDCKDNTCFLYIHCKFSDIHKALEKALKSEFHASCDEARRVARTLLLNSYRPETNPNNTNNKRRK